MKVLVYACNWCSYAGADLAGISRLQYPTSTRILRIMCTGRLSEALLLYPFWEGFDGVLVCGCHIGDCHYIAGNKKAMEVVERVKKLLSLLGIEEERLQFHQISASEAALFAQTLTSFTEMMEKLPSLALSRESVQPPPLSAEDVIRESKVYLCYNCAGCTGSCPVAEGRREFNPRRRLRRLLYKREDAADFEVHTCLTCALCRERCPKGVDMIEFMKGARALSKHVPLFAHDGALELFFKIQSLMEKEIKSVGEWAYFPGCLKVFDLIFTKELSKIGESCLNLLQRVGIDAELIDAYCCGHDLLFNGERETFYILAKKNIQFLRECGVKELVLSCPECLYIYSVEYPKLFGNLPFRVHYLGDLLIERGFTPSWDGKTLTLQDSCRLTRFLQKEDVPRALLSRSARLIEMQRSRKDALCCGSSGWRNCFFCNKQIQTKRVEEAKDTGAETLITLCPKCKIHLECAQDEGQVRIEDIFIHLLSPE